MEQRIGYLGSHVCLSLRRCCVRRSSLPRLRPRRPGATVPLGIHPSNCVITKLHLDPDRKALLERKDRNKAAAAAKGKVQESEVPQAALD